MALFSSLGDKQKVILGTSTHNGTILRRPAQGETTGARRDDVRGQRQERVDDMTQTAPRGCRVCTGILTNCTS